MATVKMSDRESELMTRHYSREASVLSAFDLATSTLYVPQESRAVEIALAIATGAEPDVGFAAIGDRSWFQIGFLAQPAMRPLTIPFRSPTHDALLLGIAREDRFVLSVEGMIPVDIPVRRSQDAFRPWLAARGWRA